MRVITFSVFAFLAVFAQAEKRLAGAHVHGLNYAQIISDGSTLQVNSELPHFSKGLTKLAILPDYECP